MLDPNGRRQLVIPDHLWATLERMSRELGSPVEALVNQAIAAYARSHGYGTTPTAPPPVPAPRAREAAPPPLRAPTPPRSRVAGRARVLEIRDDRGRVVQVEGERFVIGRGRECHLIVDSSSISREHAAIVRTKEGWFIEDLGSANGTWFHKKRVERQRIEDGDEYFLAAERLRFTVR